MINAPGPCVLFATPGMISGGFSLEVFKQWAPYEENLVTLPGYCVAGTIGHRLMSGKPTKIDLDENTVIDVRCQIHQLSFSPHTDAKGIMDLVKFLSPKHVILVHGEKPKMALLKGRIESELGIQCYYPPNHDTVSIPSTRYVKADASNAFVQSCSTPNFKFLKISGMDSELGDERVSEGVLIMEKSGKAKVVHQDELLEMVGGIKHEVQFGYCCLVKNSNIERTSDSELSSRNFGLHKLFAKLSTELTQDSIQDCGEHLQLGSFCVSVCLRDNCGYRTADDSVGDKIATTNFCCTWSAADENLAWKVIAIMKTLDLNDA